MSRNPLKSIRSLWLRFLDGPQWMRESHGLGFVFRRYRSPSLKLLFWAMAWYDRLFSRPMRLLFIVIPIFAFFALFTLNNPAGPEQKYAYQGLFHALSALNSPAIPVLLFLLALLTVDLLVGLVFRPRLSVERSFPARVRCGMAFRVTYRIRNLRRLPAADLLLDPNIELPELRRVHGFQYCSVPGRSERTFEMELKPFRRGVYSVTQGLAESAFPFNLFKHSVLFGRRELLTVHPASRAVSRLCRSAKATPSITARSRSRR